MTLSSPDERSATGAALQAELLGAAAPAPSTLFEQSWRDFVFAEVWHRPGLDRRARYLVAIAGAATDPCEMLDTYVRGALASGELSVAELREAALQVAVYAGWSRGAELDRAVTRVAAALGLACAPVPPLAAGQDAAARLAAGAAAFREVTTFDAPPPFSPYLDAGVLKFVFAEVWSRPGLDQRSRRWLTLSCVANSAAATPVRTHVHSAMASGNCTAEELLEFVLQYSVHAGWPKGALLQGAVIEMAKKVASGLPAE